MRAQRIFIGWLASLALAVPAFGGSHMWRFAEIFSDASGQVQFIEMWCDPFFDTEIFMNGLRITTENGTFTFPGNLFSHTADKRLLLATAKFASLPGAPTPDFILPDNFIPLNGGTIRYRPEANYDTWVYGPGVIPTDGTHSVEFETFLGGSQVDTYRTDLVNSPTTYMDESGTVNASCIDFDGDGFGNPGSAQCPSGAATDCNDNESTIHPNATESALAACKDGLDNDCDGQVDCGDSGCGNVVGACIPTVSEWGAAIFMLTLLCAGSVMLRGRMQAGPSLVRQWQ